MNIQKELKELQNKQDIINYFKKYGLDGDIKHIISPNDKNPLVTFEVENIQEYKRLISILKPDLLQIYEEKNGTIAYKPINKYSVVKEANNIKILQSPLLIETKTDKYNSEQIIKICAFIPRGNTENHFKIWIDAFINIFPEDAYFKETIKDVYETQTARQYNLRHAEITTTRPIFKGLETTKFYGGNVTHYAVTQEQTNVLNNLFLFF